MKIIQKYFLALIPPPEVFQQVHHIKLLIQEQFGIKYALKSPPHVTLKMPFNYNEAKESVLETKLTGFLKDKKSLNLTINGADTFGKRVIFLAITPTPELMDLQSSMKIFCKRELNLVDELSDRNYHPHMTVAFKDLKAARFDEILDLVKRESFQTSFCVDSVSILKRSAQKWNLHKNLAFLG
ncbi:2'-5' RNA ligase family protein [Algoriphagus litoralis]|uniref:2'-5' RNA ligase family protein n=1 Tax=Algoriphagus litoralis TaxID=2202829 RepID=UPI000DB90ED0|nr:2'-5' RNA ligase family protein [Algoriphagus litoralis]